MSYETAREAMALLRQSQRTIRALQILCDRYPDSTLSEMEDVIPILVIECMLPSAEQSLIQQEALRAIDSAAVQAILPPWRSETAKKPDARLQILCDRYPDSTLSEMEDVIPILVIECMLPSAEQSLIQQEALRAIDSAAVQAILPPWRSETAKKPDARFEGSSSYAA